MKLKEKVVEENDKLGKEKKRNKTNEGEGE